MPVAAVELIEICKCKLLLLVHAAALRASMLRIASYSQSVVHSYWKWTRVEFNNITKL